MPIPIIHDDTTNGQVKFNYCVREATKNHPQFEDGVEVLIDNVKILTFFNIDRLVSSFTTPTSIHILAHDVDGFDDVYNYDLMLKKLIKIPSFEYIDNVHGLIKFEHIAEAHLWYHQIIFSKTDSDFNQAKLNLNNSTKILNAGRFVSSFVTEGRLKGWIKLEGYDYRNLKTVMNTYYVNVNPVIYNCISDRSVLTLGYHQLLADPEGEIAKSHDHYIPNASILTDDDVYVYDTYTPYTPSTSRVERLEDGTRVEIWDECA